MLKTAIMNAKSVGEVEKESGIKKPKNMSQQKYKQLIAATNAGVSSINKKDMTKKKVAQMKQQLFDELSTMPQRRWDKQIAAFRRGASFTQATGNFFKRIGKDMFENSPTEMLSAHVGFLKRTIVDGFDKFATSKTGKVFKKIPFLGTGLDAYVISKDKQNSDTDIFFKTVGHLVTNIGVEAGMTAIGGIVSGITTGAEGAVAGTVVEPGGGTVVGGIGGVTVGVVGGSVTGFVAGIAATTTADDLYDDFYDQKIRNIVNGRTNDIQRAN